MATYPTQPIPTMPPFNPPKADPEELRLLKEEIKTSAAALKVPVPMVTTGGGPEGSSRFVPYGELGEGTIPESLGGSAGARVGNNAYDPETGDFYVCSMFKPYVKSVQSVKTNPTGGETYGTSASGLSVDLSAPDSKGYVTAYNMQTGQIIWADEWPHQCYGGVTVTKGGLVFAGTDEGEIQAFNAANGAKLWNFEIGAGPSMISVYEYG